MIWLKQKRLVFPFAQKPPHAIILRRSFGIGRIGLAPLCQCLIVFRNNRNDVLSVKIVLSNSHLNGFWPMLPELLYEPLLAGSSERKATMFSQTPFYSYARDRSSFPFNLLAINLVEIVGFLRTYWPILQALISVIVLLRPFPPLCFTFPFSLVFFRL